MAGGAHADGNDDAAYPFPTTRAAMTWQTALLMLLVALWAITQYGLAAHAILDLRRRPTVRGNNKVVWTLVILGVPIVGALAYAVYGPTSFIPRDRPITTVPTVPVSAIRPAINPPPSAAGSSHGQPPTVAASRSRPNGSARARATDGSDGAVQPDDSARPPEQLPSIPEWNDLHDRAGKDPSAMRTTPAKQRRIPGDSSQRRSPHGERRRPS